MMNESVIKIKLWGVIGVIITVLAFFFVTGLAMESRVTRCETTINYIVTNIDEIKGLIKEVRNDQLRRERRDSK